MSAAVVLWAVMVLNLLVASVKVALGLATGMGAVTADGLHSTTDALSNVVGLIGLRAARKPRDAGHPYGHARYETLASLAIVAFLISLAFNVLKGCVAGLQEPSFRVPSGLELALLASTLFINVLTALLEDRAGRRLASPILISDARHTLSDVWVTCGVLASIILIKYGGAPLWVDPAISAVIALLILRAAWEIFRSASDELTDHVAVDPEIITTVVMEDPEVLGVHKVRSRRSGPLIYADFHVQCKPDMRLMEVHALEHRAEARLRERLALDISCVIHAEPVKGPQTPQQTR